MTTPRKPRTHKEQFAAPIAGLVSAIEEYNAADALRYARSILLMARLWAGARKRKRPQPPRTATAPRAPEPVKPRHDPLEGGREVVRYFGFEPSF